MYAQVITGKIIEAQSGKIVTGASMRLVGTSRGTISTREGKFRLVCDGMNYCTVITSSLGYKPDTLNVSLPRDTSVTIALAAEALVGQEVIVNADREDPAYSIIRKLVARRKEVIKDLKHYRDDAYTKTTIRGLSLTDTTGERISYLTETFSTSTWKAPGERQDVITSRIQSPNFPSQANLFTAQTLADFNDDEVKLFDVKIPTPASEAGLKMYDVKLLGVVKRSEDELSSYKIEVRARSSVQLLFEGVMYVAADTTSLLGVDFTTNHAIPVAGIAELKDISMRQQFILINEKYWFPVDVRLSLGVAIKFINIGLPKISVEQISVLSNYHVNEGNDESMHNVVLAIADTADDIDSASFAHMRPVPLSRAEDVAYQEVDSSLRVKFRSRKNVSFSYLDPTNLFSVIGQGASYVHFNRVEGIYLGVSAGMRIDTGIFNSSTSINVRGGYGFSDKRWKYQFSLSQQLFRRRDIGCDIVIYDKMASAERDPDELGATLSSLFLRVDPFNYYRTRGYAVSTFFPIDFGWRATFRFIDEQRISVVKHTDYSWFSHDRAQYDENPPIIDGPFRSITLSIDWQPGKYIDAGHSGWFTVENNFHAHLALEYAPPGISEITLGKISLDLEKEFPIGQSSSLSFHGSIGAASSLRRDVPAPSDRWFVPSRGIFWRAKGDDLQTTPYARLAGDRIGSLDVVYDMDDWFFRSTGILADFGWGTELFFHAVKTEFAVEPDAVTLGNSQSTGGLFTEAGFSVTRIFGVLGFNVATRITPSTESPVWITARIGF